jgi:hypothetical protein
MKLHAQTNKVEKSGNFENSGFSIEASAKAFFILSDGLYSNKIKAVIRELSTNAYDSHVDAGVADKPFDVHLPTRLEPTFYVRDYGTSMDHEDCMQLYTTYFRSTRNQSNDAVGCLGLGSKAPFAYCDQFTVEAYLDGTRRVYTAYQGEDGSPVFSLMDESPTDEADGVKVSLSVKKDDVWDFEQESEKLYKFFTVRPNFVGGEVSFEDGDILLTGNGWEFESGSYDNHIVMGQIAYPLDYDQIKDERAHDFLYKSKGLNVYVGIGDVDITPSRESLSYNDQTKKKIVRMINDIALEIAASMEEQIADQGTLFKARMKYVALCDSCDSILVAMKALDTTITWNGEDLFQTTMGNVVENSKGLGVNHYYKSNWRKKIEVGEKMEKIHFKTDTKFVVDDLKRGGITRLRNWMQAQGENKTIHVYYFKADGYGDNPSSANEFLELLGGAKAEDVMLTSSLPKPEYNRSHSGGGGGGNIPAKLFKARTQMLENGFVDCKMSVKYEDAYYIEESRGVVQFDGKSVWINSVEKIINTLSALGYDMEKYNFYLVKPSVIRNSKLANRDNWGSGDELLTGLLEQAKEEHHDNITKVINRYKVSATSSDWREVLSSTKSNSEAKQILAEFDLYMEEIDSIRATIENLQECFRLCPSMDRVKSEQPEDAETRFASRFDKAMEKYPMLENVRSYYMETSVQQNCADYIDLVESK